MMPRGNRTARRGFGPDRSTLRSLRAPEIAAFRALALAKQYTNEFQFFIGITSGEVATVLMEPEDRAYLVQWLREQAAAHQVDGTAASAMLPELLRSLAQQLEL